MYISGIATGLDTETLIQQLMAIERRPLVLMQERKNLLQQQRDAWRDINTRLNTLRERMADLSRIDLYERRTATSSVTDVATVTAAREAAEARYNINVINLAEAHRVRSEQFVEDGQLKDLDLEGTARIGLGTELKAIEVVKGDTVADVARKINEADAGVTARVVDGHLVIEAKETGAANEIQFQHDSGDALWRELGIVDAGDAVIAANVLQEAQDAKFTVDGIEIERSSNTIDDVLAGVTLRLQGEGETVVEIKRDADAVVEAVRRFVEQYNSVMSFMSSRSGEGGVLRGDTLLMRIQFQLRSDTTSAIDAPDTAYNHLASVGISVDRHGHMSLDETKLREALAQNSASVQGLFAATKDKDGFDGVAARLESRFQAWLAAGTGLLDARQKLFGDRMRAIDDGIERMEMRLELRERNLMRQFVALEEMMAAFQTQAMWLEGQIQQLGMMTRRG